MSIEQYRTAYEELLQKYLDLLEYSFICSEDLVEANRKINVLRYKNKKLLTQPPPIENVRPNKRARLYAGTRDEVPKPDGAQNESADTTSHNTTTPASNSAIEKRRRVKVPKEKKKSEEPAVPCSAVLSGRQCKSRAQQGSAYCWRHLPLDPNSEWAWCAHTDSQGKQCSNPVLKNKPSKFCKFHTSTTAPRAGETSEAQVTGVNPRPLMTMMNTSESSSDSSDSSDSDEELTAN
jgi:hypothetical protein